MRLGVPYCPSCTCLAVFFCLCNFQAHSEPMDKAVHISQKVHFSEGTLKVAPDGTVTGPRLVPQTISVPKGFKKLRRISRSFNQN